MSVMAANNFAQDDFFIESQAAEWVRDIKISRPLLEWAGGKTQLLGEILPKIPKKYGRFIEPFFGDGAVFFCGSSSDWDCCGWQSGCFDKLK